MKDIASVFSGVKKEAVTTLRRDDFAMEQLSKRIVLALKDLHDGGNGTAVSKNGEWECSLIPCSQWLGLRQLNIEAKNREEKRHVRQA